ncbi:hypothetical protein TrST_g6414 [Triparma strigata]|uniref:Uncharacterized protein n=1 Tax=Triparma strigata TaxID=1606541 RepID=A0A9W7BXU4_9STRA|nr:hypothetical protein TrST_g6414 [Triparma strigata]
MPTSPAKPDASPVPIAPGAANSIRRQNEFLVKVVSEMSQNEEKRAAKVKACPPKMRRQLERRHADERSREFERVNRLKEETKIMKRQVEKGSYNGTKLDKSRGAVKPVSDKEVTGLESRGGLTDSQYKFLKQVYNKFEAPLPPRPSDKPRAPNISYFQDQRRQQKLGRIENQRLGLLNQKKELLTQLSYVVDRQDALIKRNEWKSTSRSTSRSLSGFTARSGMNTARSNYSVRSDASSVASMASFQGRFKPGTIHRESKPKIVPQLF